MLNNLSVADKRVKLVKPGYKVFSESSFNESYMCVVRQIFLSNIFNHIFHAILTVWIKLLTLR